MERYKPILRTILLLFFGLVASSLQPSNGLAGSASVILPLGAGMSPPLTPQSGEPPAGEHTSPGTLGNGPSSGASLYWIAGSPYPKIAFSSLASDLTAQDLNNTSDVFIWNVESGAVDLVSHDLQNATANGASSAVSASDTDKVAFNSLSSNLPIMGSQNPVDVFNDIFFVDGMLQSYSWYTSGNGGGGANGSSFNPTFSRGGDWMSFTTLATNLSNGAQSGLNIMGPNGVTTAITSFATQGESMPASNGDTVFTALGAQVGCSTSLTVLQVAIFRMALNTVEVLSRDATGSCGNANSKNPFISDSGRFIGFESLATNLTSDPITPGLSNIYLRDMQQPPVVLISKGRNLTAADGSSKNGAITPEGNIITFVSNASNLTNVEGNGFYQLYAKSRLSQAITIMQMEGGGLPDGNITAYRNYVRATKGPQGFGTMTLHAAIGTSAPSFPNSNGEQQIYYVAFPAPFNIKISTAGVKKPVWNQ